MNMKINGWALAIATFGSASALAQTAPATPAMDHSQHQKYQAPTTSQAPASNTPSTMTGMDHSKMDHAAPATMPGSMPGMNHGEMKPADATTSQKPAASMPGMDHGNMKSMDTDSASPKASAAKPEMDHGNMQTQSDSAPADARDPHAYSDGHTLDSGPYALPTSQRLRLADEHHFSSFVMNQLERSYGRNSNATAYDMQAWFGRDYDRLVIKAEGEIAKGKLQDSRTELLWGHAIAPYWNSQLGVRYDSGVAPGQGWLAAGVQGLAPYWFEVDATAYIGDNGKTALRLGAEYEILLTQKLILQPSVELNLYGKRDVAREIGSGLSSANAGLRLRYEISRQFAPYIGVERNGKFGETADLARAAGEHVAETRWVAGVRLWF